MCPADVDIHTSQKLRNLSLFFTLGVVFLHALPGMKLDGLTQHQVSTPLWIICSVFKQGFCQACVPYFFIVSGFFLAGSFMRPGCWYRGEVLKRVKTLLVPFLIWNILYWLWTATLAWIGSGKADVFSISIHDACRIVGLSSSKPALGLLWYIRCLFLLVLFSPLIRVFSMKQRVAIAWLAFCLLMYAVLAPWGWYTDFYGYFFFYCVSFVGLFWFSVGCYLRIYGGFKFPWRLSALIVVVLFAIKIVLVQRGFAYAYYLGWLAIPFVIHLAWTLMPAYGFRASFLAFPLYVLHRFWLTPLQMIGKNQTLMICLIHFSIAVIGSIVTFVLLKKFSFGLTGVFFGGRGK